MKETYGIKELLEEERPYEKCLKNGAHSLSNVELLAVILRTGTKGKSAIELARTLLDTSCGDDGILNIHHLTLDKLQTISGIGKVKAVQILCLSELSKRLSQATGKDRISFTEPSTIAAYYMEEMRHQKQENIKLLMLNSKSKLIGESDISKGTVNTAVVSPRELYIEALAKEAVAIILLHNHPSGDPAPSNSDILLTKRVKDAGGLIGVELLDHIIIGNNCYISFAEEKLL